MKDAGSRDNEHDTATRGDPPEFTVRPLPLGHRLGELQLDEVLGIGGFGIVYRAFDRTLRRAVAIKEYMPSMLATRGGDYTVSLRSERFAQAFDAGRGAFLNEARLLAQFDHPGLVKVLHFWESHGTAYMVMPFYEGRTLKQLLDGGMRIGETQLRHIVGALLGALDTLHRAQCFHRDVALDNVLIRPNGSAILLDFGAARKRIGDLVDDGAMMIKPGYAPIEQYTDDPAFSQGPWTDLYALGAVMHAMIVGDLPPAAVVRSIKDTYRPLVSRELPAGEVYSPAFLAAVDHALQLRIPDRPESVAAFAAELGLQDFDRTSAYGVAAVVPPAAAPGTDAHGGEEAGTAGGPPKRGATSEDDRESANSASAGHGDAVHPKQDRADPSPGTPSHDSSAASSGREGTAAASATAEKAPLAAVAGASASSAAASQTSGLSAEPALSDTPKQDPDRQTGEAAKANEAPRSETTGRDTAARSAGVGEHTRADAAQRSEPATASDGSNGNANRNPDAFAATAGATSSRPAASAPVRGASDPPDAPPDRATRNRFGERRMPVYLGAALVALIAVGIVATYLSRPARIAGDATSEASQPPPGTPSPASAPDTTLAQHGPTPVVVPPSSLPAGASAPSSPAPVADVPASVPSVATAASAPQVATNAAGPTASQAGSSSAIAPAGSLDASERVVTVPPSDAVAQSAPAQAQAPAPGSAAPSGADTAVATINAPAAVEQRPPPASENVVVRFHVRPWGDVYVNGARRGASPPLRSVSLAPGVYQIEIRNGSLPPLRRTVAIDFGSKPVSIDYVFE
ncbi:serine/threonine protein kinase [Burkholderia pseudomultivorans]|uniref:non-specific serine/threonine protein kinase n=1 Tax=Burkholderia pseudomultivorans TaxID=1207504 RepID=A0ABU2E6E1_9BURK|nr:serine/threonine-protein kinase [Burkholderia pseudomultivorans]MDR8728002.1 Serine/threonine-protein kinase C [Burkholderia pseudomultivorans]MDR8734113.1 Serine/threonine-protein kinase C [Burkholderia pseudomultivorans]MDR8743661.1 Serine/threonine-protein kinase C [Burkholderia pseudomultivorans]MDR8755443.1 Serine/threonine-protein kinase C [Burkholderia pseudomultivorans]MDR8779697.1 Serine/threonine-protein kinase C [Burkholderia pseudomultivorans]